MNSRQSKPYTEILGAETQFVKSQIRAIQSRVNHVGGLLVKSESDDENICSKMRDIIQTQHALHERLQKISEQIADYKRKMTLLAS